MSTISLTAGIPENSSSLGGLLYTEFFGLRELPFQLTPDKQFLFNHPSCQDALNKLLFATKSGEGFTKIIGEVGTGKTLLCRAFLDLLDEHYITAYIPNPYLEPMTLLLAIADELGIEYEHDVNQHILLKSITAFLIDTYKETGRTVVVCLDEAHAIPFRTMEALRLLSNLETSKRKLMQLVLFGQPELNERLMHSSIRQLKQRIAFYGNLGSLNRAETEDYILHRLSVAGYTGPRLFSRAALNALFRASDGIPRIINILCHKALIAAYADGVRNVGQRHVALAVEDSDVVDHAGFDRFEQIKRYLIFLATGSVVTALAGLLHNML
jgi:MSHA biogenesis protein MshM